MTTGLDFLELCKEFSPYLKTIIGKDMMVAVTDRERFIAYVPGDKIDVKAVVGERIPASDPILATIASGKTLKANVPKEAYGYPFKATMTPVFDDHGKVVGCVGIGISMETEVEVMELSTGLSQAMEQVAAAIQEIAASASEISVSEKLLGDLVTKVVEATGKINDVLSFIKQIADETKMLGLNAAIEAARAGEAGRGFGVVAQEIRKLSDESKNTVDQIRNLTNEIHDYITETKAASQKTLRASEEQAAATQEVTASIEELSSTAVNLGNIAASL